MKSAQDLIGEIIKQKIKDEDDAIKRMITDRLYDLQRKEHIYKKAQESYDSLSTKTRGELLEMYYEGD